MVTLELMGGDGAVRGTETRIVNGNGALLADVYQDLFAGFKPDPEAYLRVRSAEPVKPFELMRKPAGDIASLAGQDVSAGSDVLYSPQYVMGGPWMTTLSIINLDARTGVVEIRLYGENGAQLGETRVFALPAYGKIYIDNPELFVPAGEGIAAGYVKIVSDGIRLAGSTVFGDVSGQSFSAALPLIDNEQNTVLFSHVISNDQYFTGIAIMNPNDTDVEVAVELHGSGNQIKRTYVSIPAGHRTARLLTEYFPALRGKDLSAGFVQLTSTKPIVSFSLIGTNNLSVLSALPPQEIQ